MIPVSTTTITVLRPSDGDPYEPSASPPARVARGVRAHVSAPQGRSQIVGGEQSVVELRLVCDPCDLRHTDLVQDETSQELFVVSWVKERRGLGLDHVTAGLRHVEGAA